MTRQISPPFDSVVQTSGYLLQTRPRRDALPFPIKIRFDARDCLWLGIHTLTKNSWFKI